MPVILFLVAALGALIFMHFENAYYSPDVAFYHFLTLFGKDALVTQPFAYPLLLFASTRLPGNLLVVAPLSIWSLIFGDSRTAFITGLTTLYSVPFVLAIARLFVTLHRRKSERAFWIAASIAVLTPSVWAPSLQGLPDSIVMASVLYALSLYLKDRDLSLTRTKLTTGIALGLAPLMRKPYAFASFSLYSVILLDQVIRLVVAGDKKLAMASIRRLLLTIVISALILGILGASFVQMALTIQLGYQYHSLFVTPSNAFGYYFTAYGAIAWMLALLGFTRAFKQESVNHHAIIMLLAYTAITWIVWIFIQQHQAENFLCFFSPFVVIGCSFVLESIWSFKRSGQILALGFFFILNFVMAFCPWPFRDNMPIKSTVFGVLSVPEVEGDALSRLFSAGWPPWHRDDAKEFGDLIELIHTTREDHPADFEKPFFYIAGESMNISYGVCVDAEQRKYGRKYWTDLGFFPGMDSCGSFPIERLLHSQYAVIPEPIQNAVNLNQEHLLEMALRIFDDHWPLAHAFEKLPREYAITHGINVRLYQRTRPNTLKETALTLGQMWSYAPSLDPGDQPDWISTGELSHVSFNRTKSKYDFERNLSFNGTDEGDYLLFARPFTQASLPHGSLAITGAATRDTRISLKQIFLDKNGDPIETRTLIQNLTQGSAPFTLTAGPADTKYVVLSLSGLPNAAEPPAKSPPQAIRATLSFER